MDLATFQKQPIIAILRGVTPKQLDPLLDTALQAGLQTIEITMNTPNAAELIKQTKRIVGSRMAVGAGTVLTHSALTEALDAGASFIVSPTVVDEVMAHCVEHEIPVFPGALTPQEIHLAWQAGATMVKVFPSKFFGPDYFKEIKGPFESIRLLACGGITSENIGNYKTCGADGFAVGGSIFSPERLSQGAFEKISEDLKQLITAYQSATI